MNKQALHNSTILRALSQRLDSVIKPGITAKGFNEATEATRKIMTSPRIDRNVLKNAVETFQKIKHGLEKRALSNNVVMQSVLKRLKSIPIQQFAHASQISIPKAKAGLKASSKFMSSPLYKEMIEGDVMSNPEMRKSTQESIADLQKLKHNPQHILTTRSL